MDLAEKTDPDLANIRGDDRFAPLMANMKKEFTERTAAAEAEWKEPLILFPEGHEKMNDLGAIIVLHDTGSTKKEISKSYWKTVAADLHLVLVIPSGTNLVGKTPDKGMSWFTDYQAFTARSWVAEKSIKPANAAIKKMKAVDSDRVFIAGQGQGGLVAFNAAMRAPRLYAGVLTIDAPIVTQMTESYFPNVISAGVKVRALLNTQKVWGLKKEQIAGFAGQMRTALTQSKLAFELATYTLDETKPDLQRELVTDTLRKILPVAKTDQSPPVEAGAGK